VVAIDHQDHVVPVADLDVLFQFRVGLGERLVVALVLGVPEGLLTAMSWCCGRRDAGLVVDRAVVAALAVAVGLVAADAEGVLFVDDLDDCTPEFAVGRGELVLVVHLEVGRHRDRLVDQERLAGLFLGFRPADDAVLDGPRSPPSLPNR